MRVAYFWHCGGVLVKVCQDSLALMLLIPLPVSREVTQDMGNWVYGVLPTVKSAYCREPNGNTALMGGGLDINILL